MYTIDVKFVIDKEQKRVVFAEAGSDLVDILFSILTMPLGSLVRLLNNKSGLGSLDSLYGSVEQLEDKHLRTKACKEILLNPRNVVAELCEDLKIKNIHDCYPRNFYICPEPSCLINAKCFYSYTNKCQCSCCGKQMDKILNWRKEASEKGGVFVNQGYDFIISHDLRVMPASLMNCCSLLTELHVKDLSALEHKIIEFDTEQVWNMLQRALVSNDALTEVFFPDACMQTNLDCSLSVKEDTLDNEGEQEIILKLLLNKKNNSVLYAEVGEDFVDHLLSFLTMPLGSVLRFLPNKISLGGCINNLYKSVETLGLSYFKSDIRRSMLLTPNLSTFHGFKNQFLKMEEIKSKERTVFKSCIKCYLDNGGKSYIKCYLDNGGKSCSSSPCIHGVKQTEFIEQNPKSEKGLIEDGDAFMVSSRRFMIADDLNISPLSFIPVISNRKSLPVSDLVSMEVCMDKNKAQLLLGIMLISKTVLTDVFSPKEAQQKKKRYNHA